MNTCCIYAVKISLNIQYLHSKFHCAVEFHQSHFFFQMTKVIWFLNYFANYLSVTDFVVCACFYSFPMKREDMCRKWADAIGRYDWFPTKNSFVCSEHFLPEDYQTKPGKLKHFLKEGVVPSVFNQISRRRPMHLADNTVMKVPFVSPHQIQVS